MEEKKITPALLKAFAEYLVQEEKASATQEKYLRDLRAFAGWLAGRPVDQAAIAAWKSCLLDCGRAPSSINAALSALNSFFRFCGWHDLHAKFLRVQHRLFREPKRELTRQQYNRLIRTAKEQGKTQLSMVMETICATGIRVGEVKFITVEAARSGRAIIHLKGKVREILLPGKLSKKLLRYAKENKIAAGEIFIDGDAPGRKGTHSLSRHWIWGEMKKLCGPAGVEPSRVFPHNLRHLFATIYYNATKDIVKLADVLGHSSIETTRIYLLTSGSQHQHLLDTLGLVS